MSSIYITARGRRMEFPEGMLHRFYKGAADQNIVRRATGEYSVDSDPDLFQAFLTYVKNNTIAHQGLNWTALQAEFLKFGYRLTYDGANFHVSAV